jgi:hypothetical protein
MPSEMEAIFYIKHFDFTVTNQGGDSMYNLHSGTTVRIE